MLSRMAQTTLQWETRRKGSQEFDFSLTSSSQKNGVKLDTMDRREHKYALLLNLAPSCIFALSEEKKNGTDLKTICQTRREVAGRWREKVRKTRAGCRLLGQNRETIPVGRREGAKIPRLEIHLFSMALFV